MRGTLWVVRGRADRTGIIPAHAGNTDSVSSPMREAWDHPRACGEHLLMMSASCFRQGSSPRMRGTPVHRVIKFAERGIIPAHAGNTPCATSLTCETRDHPRACGEHPVQNSTAFANGGSSTRMRGTRINPRAITKLRGIIPAHAGNTFKDGDIELWYWDHPRACGEHIPLVSGVLSTAGSSPRMRGTRSGAGIHVAPHGIIPAHAGNTSDGNEYEAEGEDHPRACGEHIESHFATSFE